MKLDRNTLKKLIVETLQEADPRDEMTGTAYDDVRAGMESEPQPEDFEQSPENMSLTDIVGYFRSVGQEMNQRIEQLKSMPKTKIRMITDEEVAAARKEAEEAKKEMEDVSKNLEMALANLKK
jgi:hypothetical protein